MRGLTIRSLLLIILATIECTDAMAQARDRASGAYAFVFRGTQLSQALEEFSRVTGESVAYESSLVAGRMAYCVVEDVPATDALSCILRDTGLDFFRLSSGTLVLAGSAEQSPLYGYLRGVVLDYSTGEPLAEANVFLDDGLTGTSTGNGGGFVLPPLLPGTYRLSVSHIGYQGWQGTLTIGPGRIAETSVRLRPRFVAISPVVVDGTNRRLLSRQLAAPRVDADDALPASDASLFAQAASLAGVRTNNVTSDLLIDGSDAGNMRMRLDGAPIFLPREVIGLVGPFSSLALERLTLYRAGFGVGSGSLVGGVVEAEHAVHSPWSHVQVDPSGINSRIKFGGSSREQTYAAAAALRVGAWDIYSPSRLAGVLEAWSAADPFLVVAPLGLYEYATDAFVSDTLGLRTNVRPVVRYSDLHLAAEYRPSPLRTLSASLYSGSHGLSGGRRAPEELFDPQASPAQQAFSAADDYDWVNTVGQIRYTTFVGRRTLTTTQVYGSRYRLDHAYDLVDNLHLPVRENDVTESGLLFDLGQPVRDRNSIEEAGLRVSFDHSRSSHSISGGVAAVLQASSMRLFSYAAPEPSPVSTPEATDGLSIASQASIHDVASTKLVAWFEDQVQLGKSVGLTGGVRTTWVGNRRTVYAEPRASLNIDAATARSVQLSGRLAAGVYRQFETQLDLTSLNAGSLLPTVRLWLPTDGSTRPPLAYHVAASTSASRSGWSIAANAYGRFFSNVRTFNYAASELGPSPVQAAFLAPVDGRATGADVELSRTTHRYSASVTYGYVRTTRSSPLLFKGRRVPEPEVDPHRLVLAVSAVPIGPITLNATWTSGWDRTWAYTRAYYDYFGHSESLRSHLGIDFGLPDTHGLPPMHRLDLSAATTHAWGPLVAQLRVDVVNVLDRSNVASYRLVWDGAQLVETERPLIPRITSLTARVSWRW